ncbi:hypothetical protein BD413DRAFT_609409 [Trametes elegans]|nr:hypothetical protein BD413DRAFT_609409 [Trametes elegans]
MDKLPAELLSHIFRLASTDGGQTACALSLVCRHVRAVAQLHYFYTVALTGEARALERFLATHAAPARPAPRVRHLFLALADVAPSDPSFVYGEAFMGPVLRAYAARACALLRAVAPTLETLVFLPFRYAPPVLAGIAFPALRELTRGCDPAQPRDPDAPPRAAAPCYPALERLHLLSGDLDAELWAGECPRLTHLRLSNRGWRGRLNRVRDLGRQDGQIAFSFIRPGSLTDAHTSTRPAGVLPRLQQFTVQAARTPSPNYCHGMPYLMYKSRMRALWEDTAELGARVRTYILPEDGHIGDDAECDGLDAFVHDVRRGWVERVEGGESWWAAPLVHARCAYEGDAVPQHLAHCFKLELAAHA